MQSGSFIGSIRSAKHRRLAGFAMPYVVISFFVMIAFVSLGVDLGRAQLAKTQLRGAADAAARYGAQGFANNSVTANAIAVAAQNKVDGTPLVLLSSDITSGYWVLGQFKTTGGGTSAVRVIAKRLNSRNTGIPLTFASILGRSTLDITVQSIATYTPSVSVTINAQAKGDPWLAGMPSGTTANGFDSAPYDSPTAVNGLSLVAGNNLNFDFNGTVSYFPGKGAFGADGDLTRMIYNGWYSGFNTGREHGMANLTAPITSVVGVFLDNTQPDQAGALPADLDFSTSSSRDFASLSPLLRQPFFIGDGLQNDNATSQQFVVPAGATRLFIGVMDGRQWSDNSGSFSTQVNIPTTVTLVK